MIHLLFLFRKNNQIITKNEIILSFDMFINIFIKIDSIL